jgi:hypothetical protein
MNLSVIGSTEPHAGNRRRRSFIETFCSFFERGAGGLVEWVGAKCSNALRMSLHAQLRSNNIDEKRAIAGCYLPGEQ